MGLGVLAALATAERLAIRQRLPEGRIWTAALLGLVSLFIGERLLLFARSWRDFLAHPLWMLGLLSVRDMRLFYAGAALGAAVCAGYLAAARIPLSRAASALLPAAGLLLAFVHAGYFAAGSHPGRMAMGWPGVVVTNRTAHALYGTPLGVRLIPVAAYAAVGYALISLLAVWIAIRERSNAGAFLLLSGVWAVLMGQMEMRWIGEPMLLGVFTWAQGAGVVSALVGSGLLLFTR